MHICIIVSVLYLLCQRSIDCTGNEKSRQGFRSFTSSKINDHDDYWVTLVLVDNVDDGKYLAS